MSDETGKKTAAQRKETKDQDSNKNKTIPGQQEHGHEKTRKHVSKDTKLSNYSSCQQLCCAVTV
eukprot:6304464-Amphidinium_carterae.1